MAPVGTSPANRFQQAAYAWRELWRSARQYGIFCPRIASRNSHGQVDQCEAELQLRVLGEENQLEAVAANVEKREPVFRD